MKNKTIYIIIFGIVVIVAIAIASYFLFLKHPKTDPVTVKVSTAQQVEQKFDNKDSFVLIIGESLCGDCQEYKDTIVKEYVKEHGQDNIVFIYRDKTFSNTTDFHAFLDKYHIDYSKSPTTFYVKDGQVVDAHYAGHNEITSVKDFSDFIANSESDVPIELQESYVSGLTTETYGNSTGDYLVYFYLPYYSHCQDLMASSAYQDFISTPYLKMYKININDDASMGTTNPNLPSDVNSFLDAIGVTGTPTIIHVKIIDGKYKLIEKAVGTPDAENLLSKYISQ